MDYKDLRSKYPKFVFDSFSYKLEDNILKCQYKYLLPPDHTFLHTVNFESLNIASNILPQIENLVFQIGLSELFSYWKLTCSPEVVIQPGHLSTSQIQFWHKLLIYGMGQYYYENNIDFTPHDFIHISSSNVQTRNLEPLSLNSNTVLVPIGGGKDSIVTAEILKQHFHIRPIVITPTTPASLTISQMLDPTPPITVHRSLDPYMLELTKLGYLTGHIPYSSTLAFIFTLAAAVEQIPNIAVSNEASSDEGNVNYLGHTINHQYTKSSEFETDFQKYLNDLTQNQLHYFSFLRPLHELQIAKLFSTMTKYFSVFRSCNRHQQQNSWCGKCSKCISIALTLIPWIGVGQVTKIIGSNPLTDSANQQLINQMSDPLQVKPFECIVSTEEAQTCLEFINKGLTPKVQKFISKISPAPNLPKNFLKTLTDAYATT